MEYEFDKMIGFDELELRYEAHLAGLDGEDFTYSVYFENEANSDSCNKISMAIEEFFEPYDEREIYLGFIDISEADGKIVIYHDLGGVDPDYEKVAIHEILKAINTVDGVKTVIINEFSNYGYESDQDIPAVQTAEHETSALFSKKKRMHLIAAICFTISAFCSLIGVVNSANTQLGLSCFTLALCAGNAVAQFFLYFRKQ